MLGQLHFDSPVHSRTRGISEASVNLSNKLSARDKEVFHAGTGASTVFSRCVVILSTLPEIPATFWSCIGTVVDAPLNIRYRVLYRLGLEVRLDVGHSFPLWVLIVQRVISCCSQIGMLLFMLMPAVSNWPIVEARIVASALW